MLEDGHREIRHIQGRIHLVPSTRPSYCAGHLLLAVKFYLSQVTCQYKNGVKITMKLSLSSNSYPPPHWSRVGHAEFINLLELLARTTAQCQGK